MLILIKIMDVTGDMHEMLINPDDISTVLPHRILDVAGVEMMLKNRPTQIAAYFVPNVGLEAFYYSVLTKMREFNSRLKEE